MHHRRTLVAAFCATAALVIVPSQSSGQSSTPPSYIADPDVYKLLSENDQFRVILATWPPGKRDAWHSHAGALTAYNLTACKARFHTPDGKSIDRETQSGIATFSPEIPSHSFENLGTTACQAVIVERK
jgi:hypothetical protein